MSTRPSSSSVGKKKPQHFAEAEVGRFEEVGRAEPVQWSSQFGRKAWAVGAWRLDNLIRVRHKKEPRRPSKMSEAKFASVTADHDKGDERPRSVGRNTDLIAI